MHTTLIVSVDLFVGTHKKGKNTYLPRGLWWWFVGAWSSSVVIYSVTRFFGRGIITSMGMHLLGDPKQECWRTMGTPILRCLHWHSFRGQSNRIGTTLPQTRSRSSFRFLVFCKKASLFMFKSTNTPWDWHYIPIHWPLQPAQCMQICKSH